MELNASAAAVPPTHDAAVVPQIRDLAFVPASRRNTTSDYVVFALRIVIGALLLVAGILKAHDGPAATASTIAGYRLVPPSLVAPLGVALPYAEIILGAYVVGGLFTRVAGALASVQFAAFSGAVASLVVRRLPVDCGCFGSGVPTPPSWGHVAADVALTIAAAYIAWRAPGAFALDRLLFSGGSPDLPELGDTGGLAEATVAGRETSELGDTTVAGRQTREASTMQPIEATSGASDRRTEGLSVMNRVDR